MRKSRFAESQIVSIFKGLHAGAPATELGCKHGVHARGWRTVNAANQ